MDDSFPRSVIYYDTNVKRAEQPQRLGVHIVAQSSRGQQLEMDICLVASAKECLNMPKMQANKQNRTSHKWKSFEYRPPVRNDNHSNNTVKFELDFVASLTICKPS